MRPFAVGLIYNDEKNVLKSTYAMNNGKDEHSEFSNYVNKESFRRFCIGKGDHVAFEQSEIYDDWSKARCGVALGKIH